VGALHDAQVVGRALTRLGVGALRHPWRTFEAATRLTGNLVATGVGAAAVAVGGDAETPAPSPTRDRRFSDPAWQRSPWFFAAGHTYLAWSRFLRDMAANSGAEDPSRARTDFAVSMLVDALAPTNFLPTNPAALRRAAETRGLSLLQGLENFFDDLSTNKGRPRQVDRSALEVGRDLAVTPGKVVYRNELMELIQYAPQTDTVFDVPLLLSPPWINKYYVMDLAPGRSFVEWAVGRGHTVFAISYRNPDETMRDVSLDDYLLGGLGTALDVVSEITGAEQVNLAGLCVGGTLAMMLLAYLAQDEDGLLPPRSEGPLGPSAPRAPRVRSATLLNTLLDFSEPGPLGAFTDRKSVERLERRMEKRGYLEASEMAATFDSLRPNDLIWNYVANNWLMGEQAPAFDILAWNADSTRISAATHSDYLRSCYVENRLARDEMTLAGRRLRLGDISSDVYVLAASEDHITPWKSSYATTGLLRSDVRFVLSSSGHIAGIVNPPSPKRLHWTNERLTSDPDDWLAGAEEHTGSWWGDWADWIEPRAGGRRPPPPLGSSAHPALDDAPGRYVRSGHTSADRADSAVTNGSSRTNRRTRS
jgi:polyhydroxyalkanoate synthase